MKTMRFAVLGVFAISGAACSERSSTTAPDIELSAAALATAPGQNKIQCFQGLGDGWGSNGTCTLKSNGAKGSAVLDNNDGDDNPNNNYSGVYITNSTIAGSALADITQLSFSYSGDAPVGGSPRFSISVDTNGDGLHDGFLFADAVGCSDDSGNVDVINDATCALSTNFSGDSWANWAELVAAQPTWMISTNQVSFIIADQPGIYTISNVKIGKPGK